MPMYQTKMYFNLNNIITLGLMEQGRKNWRIDRNSEDWTVWLAVAVRLCGWAARTAMWLCGFAVGEEEHAVYGPHSWLVFYGQATHYIGFILDMLNGLELGCDYLVFRKKNIIGMFFFGFVRDKVSWSILISKKYIKFVWCVNIGDNWIAS